MTRQHAAWLLIGLLWVMTAAAWPLDAAVVMDRDLAPEAHGMLGGAVLTVTFAAIVATAAAVIIRCCSGPRLKPGERVVSAETYASEQRQFLETLALMHGGKLPQPGDGPSRGLRAV